MYYNKNVELDQIFSKSSKKKQFKHSNTNRKNLTISAYNSLCILIDYTSNADFHQLYWSDHRHLSQQWTMY